jgi:hypothetical protein
LLIPRKIFLFLQLGLGQNLFYKNRNTVQFPLIKRKVAVPLPFSALSRSPKIEHEDGL